MISAVYMLSKRSMHSVERGADKSGLIDSYVTQKLHRATPGELHLFPDEFADIDGNPTLAKLFIENGHLEETTLGVSRSQSIRDVRFGRLALYTLDNTPIHGHVAAKPERSIECAVREATAARLINRSDLGMKTYAPVGFLRMARSVSLLTRYVGETYSFDNVLWRNPEQQHDDEVADALAKSAISLATFHAGFQMTHGDFQPKNTAWDPKHNIPWAIDLEDAMRHVDAEMMSIGDRAKEDFAALMLTQPVRRSKDMYEMVADTYMKTYAAIGDEDQLPPVSHQTIMEIAKKPLRIPHHIER